MEPRFYNQKGLTAYSFACGYVQDIRVNDVHIELYQDGAVYATRVFRGRLGEGFERLEWVCEEDMRDAQHHFVAFTKKYLPELRKYHRELYKTGDQAVLVKDPMRNGFWRCNGYQAPSKWEAVAKAYNRRTELQKD